MYFRLCIRLYGKNRKWKYFKHFQILKKKNLKWGAIAFQCQFKFICSVEEGGGHVENSVRRLRRFEIVEKIL